MYFKEGLSNLDGLSVERAVVRVNIGDLDPTSVDNVAKVEPVGHIFVLDWSFGSLSVDPSVSDSMFDTITAVTSSNKNGPAPFCIMTGYPGSDKSPNDANTFYPYFDVCFQGVVDAYAFNPTSGIQKGMLLYVTQPDASTGGTTAVAQCRRLLCGPDLSAALRSSDPIAIALQDAPAATAFGQRALVKVLFNGFKFITQ
jgi:hypothetical protein